MSESGGPSFSGGLSLEEATRELSAAAESGDSLLYGRREVKSQLVELLATVRCGEHLQNASGAGPAKGHTLLVVGDHGSGKSTLVAEAERLCEIVHLPFLSLQPNPKEVSAALAIRDQ
eukprot:tig00000654_g2802.t1